MADADPNTRPDIDANFVAPPKGLAANNIGKAYRGRVVVKDITLTVQRGEVVALMGPNGAGKTTSFYMIMGLIEADRGMITLDGIGHIKKSPALALSGGERRRVEIARALASRPSFILLDEPFTGIDPIAIADISELVLYLKKRGIGILITDHRVRETLDIVDRASILLHTLSVYLCTA